MRAFRALVVCAAMCAWPVFAPAPGGAADKQPTSYPQSGTVISTRVQKGRRAEPVYADANGRTHREVVYILFHVYRLETPTQIYELEGGSKPTLSVGETVSFRINKDSVYVQHADKEDKYAILKVTLKKPKGAAATPPA